MYFFTSTSCLIYLSLDLFQLSVWTNMGFHVLYRKFLHCQYPEISHVLLFFYLVHKLGICGCLCRSSCKMTWACFSSCFHVWEYSCTFLCIKLHNIRRTRRIRRVRVDMKKKFYSGESLSHHFPSRTKMSRSISRSRDYKASHLRKSLKPRRHHARVEISRDLRCKSKRNHSLGEPSFTSNGIKHGNHRGTINDIKVIHTSKFTRKGISRRNRVLPRQRRQNLS
ncbi:uncharacterized protein LOC124826711 isoform X2 [Vigna umbellata]|uniref:uncharacterized protein LOC124826711 isoform X2 n=1 Tax=Vigna umbellata TaxID=87088 RepID=UPI001F5EE880|nr:uncharacterized protein LOC124826711 isoform X2 [Vigna umbellata]